MKVSAPASDITLAYEYDGTLEGLLCAIFETYARHEMPADIAPAGHVQLRLGQQTHAVVTDEAIALRVRSGIARTCGAEVYEAVRDASLSDDEHKGFIITTFVRHSMALQRNTLSDLAHPQVEPFIRLRRSVLNERHYMLQFLRFEELEGGVWFARCNPKANVVPLVMDWFVGRFNVQPFIIYDEVHDIAGVYQGREWFLVRSDVLNLPERTAQEVSMAYAWKTFYQTIAVEARYNPELRRSFMPKRLWRNITEMASPTPDTHPRRR